MRRTASRLAQGLSWFLLGLAVIIGIGLAGVAIGGTAIALGAFGGDLLSRLTAQGASGAHTMFAVLAIAIPAMSAALALVLLLRRVLLRVARGEPFHPGNPRDLQLVAALLAMLEVVGLIGFLIVPLFVTLPQDLAVKMSFEYEVDLTSWLAVLIVLVLAEVFREGARLRADAELTV